MLENVGISVKQFSSFSDVWTSHSKYKKYGILWGHIFHFNKMFDIYQTYTTIVNIGYSYMYRKLLTQHTWNVTLTYLDNTGRNLVNTSMNMHNDR